MNHQPFFVLRGKTWTQALTALWMAHQGYQYRWEPCRTSSSSTLRFYPLSFRKNIRDKLFLKLQTAKPTLRSLLAQSLFSSEELIQSIASDLPLVAPQNHKPHEWRLGDEEGIQSERLRSWSWARLYLRKSALEEAIYWNAPNKSFWHLHFHPDFGSYFDVFAPNAFRLERDLKLISKPSQLILDKKIPKRLVGRLLVEEDWRWERSQIDETWKPLATYQNAFTMPDEVGTWHPLLQHDQSWNLDKLLKLWDVIENLVKHSNPKTSAYKQWNTELRSSFLNSRRVRELWLRMECSENISPIYHWARQRLSDSAQHRVQLPL